MKKYNNGLPRKSKGITKKNRMVSFSLSTLALLDKLVPKRKQSKFVDAATKNKLKRQTKGPTMGMDDEGNVVELG